MVIKCDSNKIRYTGRWNICENSATSTANGNYFEFVFSGECAVIGFDVSDLKMPYPHIYINVDEGADVEVTLDRFIRISTFYIDTTGWIEPEPLHPNRTGHKTVSEKLSVIIKENLM